MAEITPNEIRELKDSIDTMRNALRDYDEGRNYTTPERNAERVTANWTQANERYRAIVGQLEARGITEAAAAAAVAKHTIERLDVWDRYELQDKYRAHMDEAERDMTSDAYMQTGLELEQTCERLRVPMPEDVRQLEPLLDLDEGMSI